MEIERKEKEKEKEREKEKKERGVTKLITKKLSENRRNERIKMVYRCLREM